MDAYLYQLIFLSGAFILVFLNGFFVAAEFSLVKVRATRIEEMIKQGKHRALRAQRLLGRMDEYLSASQLGITMASLGLGWIGEPSFARLFEPIFSSLGVLEPVFSHTLAVTVAFVLITFLHMVLGEQFPKILAIKLPESVIFWVAAPMIIFYKLSYPFIWFLNTSATGCLRIFGIERASEGESAHSEEELRMLLVRSGESGVLDEDEQLLLERVFDFGDRSVRQIMVPANEVVFLDMEKSFEENLDRARIHRHTRYPLCEGSLDRVIGIVNIKDFFWRYQELGPDFNLRAMHRPVRFVPENKLIKSLLKEFRRTRTHMSIVVDEFGSTVGILTLEDILEELVGEIQDEFDSEIPPSMIRKKDDRQYYIHGRALLEEVEEALAIDLHDEANDTIAGHVMMILGRTARVGDEVVLCGRYKVRVIGMRNLQITDLSVEVLD